MVDHIKKIHPGLPMSVHYLRVNVEAKVQQFLQQFNVIQVRQPLVSTLFVSCFLSFFLIEILLWYDCFLHLLAFLNSN